MSRRIVFLDRATIAPQIRVRPPLFAHELIEHAETRADQVVERLCMRRHPLRTGPVASGAQRWAAPMTTDASAQGSASR